MSDKAAGILAAAVLLAVGLWIFFSPFQTCVRHLDGANAEVWCAKNAR